MAHVMENRSERAIARPDLGFRIKRAATHALLVAVGIVVFVWSVLPIYHMVMMSLTPINAPFGGRIWPESPTLENYRIVFTQDDFFLRSFWIQLFNSAFVAVATALLTLFVAITASFAIARMQVRYGQLITNLALTSYIIPMAFLAIPFFTVMSDYGLVNNPWSLIFAMTTFASPYAIWVFRQHAENLPRELDEAAKVDGATPFQILRRVYIPLMRPAMVAIGTFAMLLAWNEYLYAFLLLSSEDRVTLTVALGFFLGQDNSPWSLLMATSVIYSLPPVALYYAFRRHMVSGLTAGGVND